MSERVEFEIVSATPAWLEGRFTVGDQQVMCAIRWNGLPEHFDVALKDAATMAVEFVRQQQRLTPEKLQAQIGMRGTLDVEV